MGAMRCSLLLSNFWPEPRAAAYCWADCSTQLQQPKVAAAAAAAAEAHIIIISSSSGNPPHGLFFCASYTPADNAEGHRHGRALQRKGILSEKVCACRGSEASMGASAHALHGEAVRVRCMVKQCECVAW